MARSWSRGHVLLVGFVRCFAFLQDPDTSRSEFSYVNDELAALVEKWRTPSPVLRNLSEAPRTSTRGTQCGLLWYYHVPKCAGTSVAKWLERLRIDNYVYNVHPLVNLRPPFSKVNFTEFYERELKHILTAPRGKLHAVLHHDHGPGLADGTIPWASIKAQLEAQGCKLIRFTHLREPVDHLTSHLYFYSRLHFYLNKDARRSNFLTKLQERGGMIDNGEIRYLLDNLVDGKTQVDGNPQARPLGQAELESAIAILRDFEHVGTMEHLDRDMRKLAAMAGVSGAKAPVPHINVNSHPDIEHDLTPDIIRLIHDRVRFDKVLYETFSSTSA